MSLVPPLLDDRRFDDLKAEALERIRLNCPEWTDFNASDPGITLVELFAWFTDLMLYRMNQLPDKLHGELLSLVGIQPEPAKAARAVIEFTPPENESGPEMIPQYTSSVPIDAGTDRPVTFQTTRNLLMVRKKLKAVVRRISDTNVDLTKLNEAADRGFDPFGDTGERDTALVLRIEAKSDDLPEKIFPSVITLHATGMKRSGSADIEFSDAVALGVRPRTPPLLWSAGMADDLWEPLEVIEDETRGFERDGFIRIAGPRRARPIDTTPDKALDQKQYVFELRCLVGGAGFAFGRAPRLRHLALNAVQAVALTKELEDFLGTSTGLQGQVFNLRNRPVEPQSIRVVTRASEDAPREKDVVWTQTSDFSDSKSVDKHFVLDAANGKISFGDGTQGQIPAAGQRIVAKEYRAGGGPQGNVNSKAITFAVSKASGVNLLAAEKGSAAEPAEHLRQRAAARLRSRDRAVTCADFEELAVRKGQMARAKAIGGLHPDFPELIDRMPGSITVFIVSPPRLEGKLPPWPSDSEIDQVTAVLDERRMVGLELSVRPAHILPVRVTVEALAVPGYPVDEVARAVTQALNTWLNSDERGFGTRLNAGDLWASAAQATVGQTRVIAQMLSLSAEVGGKIIGTALEPNDRPSMIMEFSKSASSDALTAMTIPAHSIVWGRPDHRIRLGGATP